MGSQLCPFDYLRLKEGRMEKYISLKKSCILLRVCVRRLSWKTFLPDFTVGRKQVDAGFVMMGKIFFIESVGFIAIEQGIRAMLPCN